MQLKLGNIQYAYKQTHPYKYIYIYKLFNAYTTKCCIILEIVKKYQESLDSMYVIIIQFIVD